MYLEQENAALIADNTKVFKINKQHKKKIAELGNFSFRNQTNSERRKDYR